MKILFAETRYDDKISKEFIQKYKEEIKRAHKEARKLLPFGSEYMNFFVQPRTTGLIKETGDSAHTYNSEFIELAFDPTRDEKGLKKILAGVRPGVFHEMNHAARFHKKIWHKTFLDSCIMEGLATVFERDYADDKAPWADYPKEVSAWIEEIIKKNDMFNWRHYSFSHPDGRRWIAYKVGTYIIDQAMKNSGKSVVELTQMECSEILKLADIDTANYKGL